MLAVAEPLADALALLVAVIVTLGGLGGAAGAVYSPAAEMVPAAALPPAVPFTLQVTAVFTEFVTVAVNCWVAEGATVTRDGATVTVTDGGAGGWTVTVAVPVDDGLCALAACTVTLAGLGTAAGAVYKPALEIVPTVAFPPATLLTLQVTPVFAAPFTVAVNCCVFVTGTPALAGPTETVTGAAAVMLRLTGPLVVPPRPLFVTVMGTLVPTWAAVAVPVALRPVDESSIVVSGVLPKFTTEVAAKFAPLSEMVKVPTGTEVGEVLQSCTGGWVIVMVTVPNLVLSAVLVACTVTAFMAGTTAGALYRPVVETVP
jgi:hypothetical protein